MAVAATKQCLRVHTLELLPVTPVQTLVSELRAGRYSLCLLAQEAAPPLRHVITQLQGGGQGGRAGGEGVGGGAGGVAGAGLRCLLLVGPEGDFTPEELRALVSAGALLVGLGGNRLRTETAAIALLAAVRVLHE